MALRAVRAPLLLVLAAAGGAASQSPAASTCSGAPVEVFDNTNGAAVQNGGKGGEPQPQGQELLPHVDRHYHWNTGHGKSPSSVGLSGAMMSASATARGSSGQ